MPNPYRIAVIGDSVAWGQGLIDAHKYAFQVAARYGQPPAVELNLLAHSGAVINATNGGVTSASPEVPEALPTIMSQVRSISTPATVDLVILNGGINDIGIETILDPLTSKKDLHNDTVDACYTGMKALIANAVSVFTQPTCKFIVTGYYPILSQDSDPFATSEDALTHLLGIFGNGFPVTLGRADQETIISALVVLAVQFWQDSNQLLAQAVAESAAALNLGNRLAYVPNAFSETNSLFASDPWLFGFGPDLLPEDEVIPQRTAACNIQYSALDPIERVICYHASVGHPNVAGANAFAQAILGVL